MTRHCDKAESAEGCSYREQNGRWLPTEKEDQIEHSEAAGRQFGATRSMSRVSRSTDMAQAGGKDPSKLPDALEAAKQSMRDQLSQ